MTMRAIIVDDEPLARQRLRKFLAANPAFELVAECENGSEAVDALRRLRPELLLLDIQMPEMDGFQVLESLADDELPAVIFCTAYDEFALKAFEVHAIDYLLKPIDPVRFRAALDRARALISGSGESGLIRRLLQSIRESRQSPAERIVVKTGSRQLFLRIDEIEWIAAAENYVRVHVGSESFLVRQTLAAVGEKLDPQRFVRIQRSVIVNTDQIAEIEQTARDECYVKLRNGRRLPVGKTFRRNLDVVLSRQTKL